MLHSHFLDLSGNLKRKAVTLHNSVIIVFETFLISNYSMVALHSCSQIDCILLKWRVSSKYV